MKRTGALIAIAVLLAGCGSDADDTSESEESAEVVATAEPPADPVQKTCSSKRENAGRVYEYDRAEMSQTEALEAFCGPVKQTTFGPTTRTRNWTGHEASVPAPTPNALPNQIVPPCDSEWLVTELWINLLQYDFDSLYDAISARAADLTRYFYQRVKSAMSSGASEIDSLANRCPNEYYEALWNDMRANWNDLRNACRRDSAGASLGGC